MADNKNSTMAHHQRAIPLAFCLSMLLAFLVWSFIAGARTNTHVAVTFSLTSNRQNLSTPSAQHSVMIKGGQLKPPSSLNESTAMFAFIARNEANELPHVLHNIKRLSAKFKKVYVLMVENDSNDDTMLVFNKWLEAQHTVYGEARSYRWNAPGGRDLRLYARARNVYLQALTERYSDTDVLITVDADMCMPWDADKFEHVLNALLFPSSPLDAKPGVDAVYAYGACGWFSGPHRSAPKLPPYTPGAFARYCDLFALQDDTGKRYVTKSGDSYPAHVAAAWRLPVVPGGGFNSTAAAALPTEGLCEVAKLQGVPGCTVINGQAVIPARSGFGGVGVFRAALFKEAAGNVHDDSVNSSRDDAVHSQVAADAQNDTSRLPTAGFQSCRYGSDDVGDECEHVPLGNCLHARGYTQVIALQLVVGWEKEACSGPPRDSLTSQELALNWGDCPCNHV